MPARVQWTLALLVLGNLGCARAQVVYRAGTPSRGAEMVNYGVDFSFAGFSDPHLEERDVRENLIPTWNRETTVELNEVLVGLFELRSTIKETKAANVRTSDDAFGFVYSEARADEIPNEDLIDGIIDRYRESDKDGVGFLMLVDFMMVDGPVQAHGILWDQRSGDVLMVIRGRGIAAGHGVLYPYLDALADIAGQITDAIAASVGGPT